MVLNIISELRSVINDKPLITVLFPASGFGVSYIPVIVIRDNVFLNIIDLATPYIRFIFLLLTLILTVVSLILQCRKLRNKKNK